MCDVLYLVCVRWRSQFVHYTRQFTLVNVIQTAPLHATAVCIRPTLCSPQLVPSLRCLRFCDTAVRHKEEVDFLFPLRTFVSPLIVYEHTSVAGHR